MVAELLPFELDTEPPVCASVVAEPRTNERQQRARLLAVVKIWQGGFLDMSGELVNRGNRGLALGHDSRDISFGEHEYLLAPLNAAGKPVDFSFKEGKFGDFATFKAALESKEDQLAKIAAQDAQFLGYSRDSRDKLAAPVFRYRVGKNVIETSTAISNTGDLVIRLKGKLANAQSFALNPMLLKSATVSGGTREGDRLTLPAGNADVMVRASIPVAANAWRPPASTPGWVRRTGIWTGRSDAMRPCSAPCRS